MSVADRRSFLHRTAVLGAAHAVGMLAAVARPSRAAPLGGGPVDGVKAMVFDVFGTLVDWRTCVARESRAILEPRGFDLDWIAFADAWRAEYQPGMEEIRSGRKPFSKLDVVHRGMLERIRPRFGLDGLDEATLAELNLVWHRLDAWPDVPAALRQLRTRYLLGPCSNGNISLMVDLARRNDIRWDAILGAEIAGDYKPKPKVYLAAAEALGLRPAETMMVAAHVNDLQAAAAVGLRTGFVSQPDEFGRNTGETAEQITAKGGVDIVARSFTEFAARMTA
ncbi:MAG: haloacid dehalogenase type II [Burkholderiales bacterium]|jgi:2-haloacid dehalogenase|nr:haloacid dehalogenase type II [Burkholderiales bacterium]